jgi:CRP-like cAMP-binding protein
MAIDTTSKNRWASVPEALSRPLFVAARPRGLKAGQVLFASGDAGDGCYLLDRGLLRVTVTSSRGEERTIAMLGPGAVVGALKAAEPAASRCLPELSHPIKLKPIKLKPRPLDHETRQRDF